MLSIRDKQGGYSLKGGILNNNTPDLYKCKAFQIVTENSNTIKTLMGTRMKAATEYDTRRCHKDRQIFQM